MNKQNREDLQKAIDKATEAMETIRRIAEEEREKFDNLPEGLQQGDKGQAIEQAADGLEQAADEIDSAVSTASEYL